MKVAVAQLGARRHYLVPRALNEAGMLERLYTDIYGTARWRRSRTRSCREKLQPKSIRRLADRVPAGIDPERITTFTRFALEYKWRCRRAGDTSELTAAWLWGGRRFCELVLEHDLTGADTVYAFNSAALELLRAAREMGRTAILDQTIAPREVERRILEEERKCWPGWESEPQQDEYLDQYCAREREEWEISRSHPVRVGLREGRNHYLRRTGGTLRGCALRPR